MNINAYDESTIAKVIDKFASTVKLGEKSALNRYDLFIVNVLEMQRWCKDCVKVCLWTSGYGGPIFML